MKRFVASAAFVVLAFSVAAADEAAAKKLNGSYQVLRSNRRRKTRRREEGSSQGVHDQGRCNLHQEGGWREGRYRQVLSRSEAKKPTHIDISPGGDETVMGIYEAKETDKGLELTLAFPKNPTSPRPKDFKGEGADEIVVKLLRKK